ncbi:hypothetical protein NKJ09_28380 [Mesorhizobium sp. M0189]|uniref:hypothetical protein n=1 Tax=Mesorhizobium sp. M0189 TaxID=2956909 RepID=UPI00333DB668
MSKVDGEIKKLDELVKDAVPALNAVLKSAGVELLGTGKAQVSCDETHTVR